MHFFSLFSISQQSLVSLSMVTFSHLSSAQKTEKRGPRKEVLLLLLLPMKSKRTSSSGDGQIVCEQAKQKHTHTCTETDRITKKMYKKGERWDELKHRKSEVVKQRER